MPIEYRYNGHNLNNNDFHLSNTLYALETLIMMKALNDMLNKSGK